MGIRQLQRAMISLCDLEIIQYPRAVLVKRLVDIDYLQLVAGSGEGQTLSIKPKGTLYFKKRDGSPINAYGINGSYLIISSVEHCLEVDLWLIVTQKGK